MWRKGDEFDLFLQAFSWETDLSVTLSDFVENKCKIGKGDIYLTENRLIETKCGMRQIITIIFVTYVQKNC